MSRPDDRVWWITGAGRGIGRALTEAALAAGERVIATVRRPDALDDLQNNHEEDLLVEVLDVRDRATARRVAERGVRRFGRLDVVVNNAGHGLVGTLEEVSEADARKIVDTNLFGALWVTQAALPQLRRQGGGHIVQVSSVGGVGSMPAMGMYNASKWALEGLSEALAGEVARFGIRVTIAELGGFSTAWAGASMHFAQPVAAYDELRRDLFGTATVPWDPPDPGSATIEAPPSLAAAAIRAHVAAPDGPLRLLVGEDAPCFVAMALAARRDDYGRDARFAWPAARPAGPVLLRSAEAG
jgi:NAD(P)-dependent dehydrogenase (short-subunit alcohol dehydrogenase family)